MALSIDITNPVTGATMAYHTILIGKSSRIINGINLTISSFISEGAANANKVPFKWDVFIDKESDIYTTWFDESVVSQAGKTDLKQAYALIKTLDGSQSQDEIFGCLIGIDFTEAEDC